MSGTQPPFPTPIQQDNASALRNEFFDEVKLRLGFGIIDIELDPPHYEYALKRALLRYRQKSSNAVQESFLFLDVQPNVSQYTLPPEVQEVTAIYRRSIGGTAGGAAVDPFSLAFTNNIYMIQNPGGLGGGGVGTLATYDFAMQYQNLVGRMFGRDILYNYNPSTHVLYLERNLMHTEQIAIHAFITKSESMILNDPSARIWVQDYTIANLLVILGEGRSKFSSVAGPQGGGISLNGSDLLARGAAEMERLDKEIDQLVDSQTGWGVVIG